MTDAGKATSIVTPLTARDSGNPFSKVSVGTVGPNTELYPLASSTLTDNVQLFDVALDATNKKLYGIGPNTQGQDTLFSIDPGLAASFADAGIERSDQIKAIGTVKDSANAVFSSNFNALEFAANKLYAIGLNRKLYTIDPTTTVATVAGDLPVGFLSSGDLVYDAAGGRFLATSATLDSDELWSIPVAAPATATKIGTNIGFKGVTGLSFEGTKLTGFTSGSAGVGDRVEINLTTGIGRAEDKIGDNSIPPLNGGISGASTIIGSPSATTNLAPTGINFTNALTSIGSNTSTAAAVKVADLSAIDDGLGTNAFSLAGTDAASFEITGTSLFLKAGTVLNATTKPSFGLTVNVDDAAVGTLTPDASKSFTLAVVATNLAPTGIKFTNDLTSIGSTTSTAAAVRVADLSAIDDGLGTNVFSLAGTDAASFEITGNSLFLKAGTVLNATTKPSFGLTVNVDDAAVGTLTPDASKSFTLAVTTPAILPKPPTGTPGTKGQSATQRTIDLTDYAGTLKADIKTNGDAAYTNNIGFYAVQDSSGSIVVNGKTIKPTDANYALEAVKSAILRAGKNDSQLNKDVAGGSIYAPVVVAQGSLTEFVAKNSSNGGDGNLIHAYFNYLGANPDKFDHFKLTGTNTFAVEDQYGGGDRDFNDLVVTMNIKTA